MAVSLRIVAGAAVPPAADPYYTGRLIAPPRVRPSPWHPPRACPYLGPGRI